MSTIGPQNTERNSPVNHEAPVEKTVAPKKENPVQKLWNNIRFNLPLENIGIIAKGGVQLLKTGAQKIQCKATQMTQAFKNSTVYTFTKNKFDHMRSKKIDREIKATIQESKAEGKVTGLVERTKLGGGNRDSVVMGVAHKVTGLIKKEPESRTSRSYTKNDREYPVNVPPSNYKKEYAEAMKIHNKNISTDVEEKTLDSKAGLAALSKFIGEASAGNDYKIHKKGDDDPILILKQNKKPDERVGTSANAKRAVETVLDMIHKEQQKLELALAGNPNILKDKNSLEYKNFETISELLNKLNEWDWFDKALDNKTVDEKEVLMTLFNDRTELQMSLLERS